VLDIRLVRETPDVVRRDLAKRGDEARTRLLEDVIRKDKEWREALQKVEALRRRRNEITRDVAEAKRGKRDASTLMKEAADLPAQIKGLEERNEALEREVRTGLMRLPNLLHESVPVGKDDTENVEVAKWGTPRTPDFELKSHGELLEALRLADFERARKIAGSGFVYLMGDLVRLDLALIMFSMDHMVKAGFTPVFPPFMMRRAAYEGVTDLGDFETVMYKVQDEDLYLIATSEHPIGAMFQDEVIDEDLLPLAFAGLSTNFRREIGGHGVDTKGLFRMHQFNKVEQFAFCAPEDSWKIHEEMMAVTEGLFQALGLPYRVITLCSADTGLVMAKTYDMEAWFPRQAAYAEVASISNAIDYQARRLNIRVGRHGGEKRVAHTLNGTAIATSRALVAILENHQDADGTVTVPQVLRPFMGGRAALGGPRTA